VRDLHYRPTYETGTNERRNRHVHRGEQGAGAPFRGGILEPWEHGHRGRANGAGRRDQHANGGETLDLEGLKSFNVAFRAAFPDWHSTFEELVAEGDRVAERWTGRGTHRGELWGIPPTGKRVEGPGSVFYRISGGKIVEFRGQFDIMGLMQQLGVISPPQHAEA
jgi:predicted ester cyclase